jgi:O-succinylbenzoic acid--CoA ligase
LTHVAGWQVLVRSLLERREPLCYGPEPFDAAVFGAVLRRAARDDGVGNCSLVPTQLQRVLADPAASAAARGLTVLLGGAAAPPTLLSRADQAGITVVTSYGSTETCGGCLYDGVPLPGVRTAIDADARLRIGGDVLASGYRDQTPGFVDSGGRWFVTDDLARIRDGRVMITGRVDDVIITGGEKVSPVEVEALLAGLDGIEEACVVGVPDDDWGQQVVALVRLSAVGGGTSTGGDPSRIDLSSVREVVTATLGRHCAPRRVFVVDDLPRLGIGKLDRRTAARSAGALLRGE